MTFALDDEDARKGYRLICIGSPLSGVGLDAWSSMDEGKGTISPYEKALTPGPELPILPARGSRILPPP